MDLATVQIKERPGRPDEARPLIVLRNADGKMLKRAKWVGDKLEGFDCVYQALLDLRKKSEGIKPDYDRPYQRDWKSASATAGTSAVFDIKCRKKNDAITVSTEGDKIIFTITSGNGIGGATVDRKTDRWPDDLILRVRLRGLESLTLSSGDTKLAASVLSHGENQHLLHLWKDGKEGPQVEKDSPYWMDIQTLDAGGKASQGLPEKGGWFEMKIPKALLRDQPNTIKLEWIDFYRG